MANTERPMPDEAQQSASDEKKKKKAVWPVLHYVQRAGNKALSLVVALLAGSLILYSGYVLYDTFYTQNQAFSESWDVMKYRPEIIDDAAKPLSGGDALTEINQDYRGWLTLYDTNIDYPVMQGEDDLYYAAHDVYKETSLTGSIYMSAENEPSLNDEYNVVYGHHMDNMAMFGGLNQFADEEYFAEHRNGIVVSWDTVYDLTVFAVVQTNAYERIVYVVGDISDELIEYIDANAIVKDMSAVEGAEKIIAFSTCDGAETNGRLVVFATMTPRELDPSQITVFADHNEFLALTVTGYSGKYDSQAHAVDASTNLPDARIEYSIDGGTVWSSLPPAITNVGTVIVNVRATHEEFGTVTTETVLHVDPAELTVRVNDAAKNFGAADPAFTATVEGLIGNDTVDYTIVRTGADEQVGVYPGVLVASGETQQGNYLVTYIPGNFTITANTMAISVSAYDGPYDGQAHAPVVTVSVPNAKIEYSVDGGKTWSTIPPELTDAGQMTVLVRVSAENYKTETAEVTLVVQRREAVVTVNAATKMAGNDDPEFTVQIEGVVDGYELAYTVTRPGAGRDETAGCYENAIVANGEAEQGNYIVTYVPGDFTITEAIQTVPAEDAQQPGPEGGNGSPADAAEDPAEPSFLDGFAPEESKNNGWALLNLIAMLMTVYILFPVLHLKSTFGRAKEMERLNEQSETPLYDVKKFRRKFFIGMGLKALLSAGSLASFLLMSDMSRPMALIDKNTPLMLVLLIGCWIADIVFE